MKLKLGFSTCPNDTFIFDAMVHHKVDTEGLEFETTMADVETLNKKALEAEIHITKLSTCSFYEVARHYKILDSGSAIGHKNGPLVISRHSGVMPLDSFSLVAVPGFHTTANLLFSLFFPQAGKKREYLFSEIEDVVLNGEADAGVIIHENRFTYEARGLCKLADLGELWEMKTGWPVPLGVIAIDASLPLPVQQKVNRIMRRSVEFALRNPASSVTFVKQYAGIQDETIIEKHIRLYVNDFTVEMGDLGKQAVNALATEAMKIGIVHKNVDNYFVG